MSQYRIEKFRYPVIVTLAGGERIAGDMFVQAYARFRSGPEEPPDILNGAEPFFPLVDERGDTLLIAKDQVAEVEAAVTEADDEFRLAGLRPEVIEITLVGGELRQGAVHLEVATDRPRLLDYLNRFDHRFLALQTTDGVRLINRRQIARVRPLD
jgi:hypothetical protein